MKRPYILATALVALFCMPLLALADVAPSGYQTSALTLPAESPIQMDHEVVHFMIPDPRTSATDTYEGIPTTATFWMANSTNAPFTVTSTFPLHDASDIIYVEASSVHVTVDGKPVTGQVRDSTYPSRNPYDGSLENLTSTGYEFPLTVGPKSTAIVVVHYDAPTTWAYKCGSTGSAFSYYLGSGAGWKGPIKEARIEVEYPLDHSDNLVRLGGGEGIGGYPPSSTKPTIEQNGRVTTFVYKNLEPTEDSTIAISFQDPTTEQALRDAQQEIDAHPNDPKGYQDLAGADYDQYASSTIKALELEYGSSTNPNTGAGAYEALDFYSSGWSFVPDGECAELGVYDATSVNTLLNNIRNRTWQPSDYADLQKIQDRLDQAKTGWLFEEGDGMMTSAGYELPLTIATLPFIHSSTGTIPYGNDIVPNTAPTSTPSPTQPTAVTPSTAQTTRTAAVAFLVLALVDGLIALILWNRWKGKKK